MKIIDRTLLILAASSLIAIVMISVSDEASSAGMVKLSTLQSETTESETSKTAEDSDGDIVVYSKEIDDAIEKYFETIHSNPDQAEEESRLLGESQASFSGLENNLSYSDHPLEKAIKNALNPENTVEIDEHTETPHEEATETTKPEHNNEFRIEKHIVRQGESLWRIAQKYNVPVFTIASANPSISKNMIRPGDKLRIPNKKGVLHRVKKGETLSNIASKYKVALTDIREKNEILGSHISIGQEVFIPDAKPLPVFRYIQKKRFIWPIQGRLTSRYGWRKHPFSGRKQFHPGIDLGARWGTSIRAAANGVVVFAGRSGAYGKLIVLRHRDGYFSAYAHCSRLLVKKGRYVKQGQGIARVGSTGTSTGSHLHFEIKRYKKKVNPFTAMSSKIRVKVPAG